ncbi:hypothetical protein ACFE04_030850 [Oxalis oulophora]
MASNPHNNSGGKSSPPKPWEQTGTSSSSLPSPFNPPSSAGRTSDVVEASGTATHGENFVTNTNQALATNNVARPVPARPWQQTNYGNTYGGYGSGYGNTGYGGGMYGGGGLYGNDMYNRGGYGGLYGGAAGGMYGGGPGGMYNGGYGGAMGGGYGMGIGPLGQAPYSGNQDPNNPHGGPPSPPGFWISFLRVLQGLVEFFGRISMLIDQNTQAFHLFLTSLLQLFDRGGLLYGELARFVLRILGIKTKPRKAPGPAGQPKEFPGPHNPQGNQNLIEGAKVAPSSAWDNVWGGNGSS